MKLLFRSILSLSLLCLLVAGVAPAQKKKPNPDDGLVLPPILPEKKPSKKDQQTQAPPARVEIPAAVGADTARLSFQVAPLSSKGLLSQQTREAMKALLRTSRAATVLKLRAFVAGSGDLRRIGEIAGEVFTERHQPLPVISVIQVGALPLEGAQVLLESIEQERQEVNPRGLAFISGQAADDLLRSLAQVASAVKAIDGGDVLRVSCFVSSLEADRGATARVSAAFPQAATSVVQMQRGPVTPGAECEAVARLKSTQAEPVRFVNPTDLPPSGPYTQIAAVSAPKLVLTGIQMGFGSQDQDIKLVFERLGRALTSFQSNFDRLVNSTIYVTTPSLIPQIRAVRAGFYSKALPPSSTLLPFEGLPSMDASFGVDAIAIVP